MKGRDSRTLRPRRVFTPAPSIAAVLVLLVGSVLPATPPQPSDGARATSLSSATPTDEPPASLTEVPEPEPAPQSNPPTTAAAVAAAARQETPRTSPWPVPEVLLAAYRQAAAGSPPACHLPVSLLAAIGQVESGSLAGRSIDATHRAAPPVLGPVLDGVGTAAIRDTDGGRLDGDSRWDRAVGPMQFIPGTWARFGVDGDGDGRADPQNVYDATAAASGYLCAGGRDLALPSGLRSAILSYNHSNAYLATVLAWQQRFTASGTTQAVIDAISTPTMPGTNGHGSTNAIASTPTPGSTPTATGTPGTTGIPSTPGTPTATSTRVASRLAFTTVPSAAATSGTALHQQPVVTVQDWAGNTVTTDTSSVTLTLTTSNGATLTCATNATAAAYGVASFAGCAIDKAGAYTLTATDGSLMPATSTTVAITAGAPATVTVVSGSAQSAAVGQNFTSPLVARVKDANGNPVSGVTLTFSAPKAGASGTFDNTTATFAAISDANGLAPSGANAPATTTGVFRANMTAGTYSLTVSAGFISSSYTLTNSPGAASTFAITSAPLAGPASADASLGPITVELQDLYGNPVPAPTGGAAVALASDSAGTAVFATTLAGTSVASVFIPAGKSSVAFYYGDTAPGSPVITTSGLLTRAKQTETITAKPSPTTTAP